jgi:hypothetical protein
MSGSMDTACHLVRKAASPAVRGEHPSPTAISKTPSKAHAPPPASLRVRVEPPATCRGEGQVEVGAGKEAREEEETDGGEVLEEQLRRMVE